MNKLTALVSGLVLSLLPAMVFAEMGMMNMSIDRHRYVMRNGTGPEYSSKDNPFAVTREI